MLIAFVFGEIIAQLRQIHLISLRESVFMLFLGIITIFILFFKSKIKIALSIAFMMLSALWAMSITLDYLESEKNFYKHNEKEVIATGFISSIELGQYNNKIYLKDVLINNKKYPLIVVLKNPSLEDESYFKIGRKVVFSIETTKMERPSNPGNFNEEKYYKSIGVVGKAKLIDILKIYSNYSDSQEYLSDLRKYLEKKLDQIKSSKSPIFNTLINNNIGIFKTILLGEKMEDAQKKEIFRMAGIAHILAISGLHISIIGLGLYKLIRKKRGIKLSAIIAITVVVMFSVMTGMSLSAKRAMIMFIIYMISQVLGRKEDSINSISFAALFILAYNPMAIINSGFQLSFVAIISIKVLLPMIMVIVRDLKIKWLKIIIPGLMVWSMICPLIAYSYYELPSFSIILNLLVVPLMVIPMITGIIALLVSLLSPIIGGKVLVISKILLLPGSGIFALYYKLSDIAIKLPLGNVIVGRVNTILMLAYYMCYIGVVILINRAYKNEANKFRELKKNIKENGLSSKTQINNTFIYRKKLKALLGLWGISVVLVQSLIYINPYFNKSQIIFMDVGQGDGSCFIADCNNAVTIDIGSSSIDEVGKRKVEPCLKSMGVKRIKYSIMTHADDDHISGLKELIIDSSSGGIKIDSLILPDIFLKDDSYNELVNLAKNNHIKVLYITKNMNFNVKNMTFSCIHPGGENLGDDRNDYSTVLKVDVDNLSILMTGDISSKIEEEYINKNLDGPVDFLKVAHHGSKYSSGDEFLKKAKPKFAIISCGKNNRYGHPSSEVLERLKSVGCKYFRTDEKGAVRIIKNDKGYSLHQELE